MVTDLLSLDPSPIHFGTDGWRGVLGVDFTIERLLKVAAAAAQELEYSAPKELNSNQVIIGFDRRFLAPEMAEAVASAIRGCNLEPLMAEGCVPTPACSWGVVNRKALGALVITASHNPPEWLGLKIKGPFGGSVDETFTKAVEKRLALNVIHHPVGGVTKRFDCRQEHLDCLQSKFDLPSLVKGLKDIGLKIIVDSMYGSAAGCIQDLLGENNNGLVNEIHSRRDVLFGGNPPEPLEKYLEELIAAVKLSNENGMPAIGLVFDGDGDRIAAIDEHGNYCSTQLLMPLLIDHLVRVRNLPGTVVKTVSCSDLMADLTSKLGRELVELPVGFKYIASKMLSEQVLIGGEESGGVGFGMHLPERDALFTALLVLESLKVSALPLGECLRRIKEPFGDSFYDRIDLRLANMEARRTLESLLIDNPPTNVAGLKVVDVIRTDGVKLRLANKHWLMFRFSGTEPLLRIYCEAPDLERVKENLNWAKQLAMNV